MAMNEWAFFHQHLPDIRELWTMTLVTALAVSLVVGLLRR